MPLPSALKIINGEESPDLLGATREPIQAAWPEFMLHDPVAELMSDCYTRLPRFQFVLVEHEGNETVAIANSIPLRYEGELEELPEDGWDWAIQKGFADLDSGLSPNLLCALQIVVFSGHRGKGISRIALENMKARAVAEGLPGLIAPVRPNKKAEHPEVSIDEYITWKREDGRLFDPWLRVHADRGARIIKPCHSAMRIKGTIKEWESWTGMTFDESGQVIVPGALIPINVDLDANQAEYIEPNVWMYHAAKAR